MTEPMAKWLTKRYAALWNDLKDKKFSFREAKEKLDENNDKTLSVILSDFKKHGWLDVELDPKSSRKRLYKLKPPKQIMLEIADEENLS